MRLLEMKIHRIAIDDTGKSNVVVLKEKRGKRFLPIFIGTNDAKNIENTIKGLKLSRPTTHDLFTEICESANIDIISVSISNVVDSTFYADINFRPLSAEKPETLTVDARPSDALAIALKTSCPVYCSDAILEEAGIMLS